MIVLGSLESADGDFLLVLIEFFSLGVMAEALRANIGSKSALEREPVEGALKTRDWKTRE